MLQLGPYPLDNVEIWGLAWPVKECHMTAGEPVLVVLGSVLQIIILLENEATTKIIAYIRTHGVSQGCMYTETYPLFTESASGDTCQGEGRIPKP
ncbi:hypothetical protein AVEN_204690-1 [Araneus ventricosus]|uniref:Uncharacterized protein n=1 Tax=Araneus ventricosus TaxID=182803 RepID=A0A4Y2GKW4_ARAVE|nr:hypothetical protein AVEN_204690-1 [Araneus ventricosus]